MKVFMTRKSLVVLAGILMAWGVSAHEGHDVPGTVKSVYGGVVKTGKVAHLEYVVGGGELKIYPIPHAGETLPTELSVTAKAEPKKENSYDLGLVKKDKYYSAKIDLKGAHRLPVIIEVKSKNLKDTHKIQVEAE